MVYTLQQLRDNTKEREAKILSRVTGNEAATNWRSLLDAFAMMNELFAIYEIDQRHIEQAKQYYYICGRLQAIAVKKYNARLFDHSITSAGNVLLSDNRELIRHFAGLRYTAGDSGGTGMEQMVAEGEFPIWCHTVFMFVLDAQKTIERNLQLIENVTLNKQPSRRELMQPDLDFFKGLYAGDIKVMEKALGELVSPRLHKARNEDPVLAQHISQPAISYAKLAWYKGFEVTVDSPLVPAEMLPVKPLDTYEDTYGFLKTLTEGQ